MSQVYSPNAAMVQGLNKALAAPESENFAVKGGRVFARAVANTALTTTALVETVAAAILTIIASPLYITSYTKGAFDWAKEHTVVAANATQNAAAGIIGRAQVTVETPAPAPKTEWEKGKEKAAELYAQAMNKGSEIYAKTERKHYIAIGTAVSALMAGYYFNIHGR